MILNENFLYSHFPKSGGTFIRNFLLETTESAYLKGQDHRPLSLFINDETDPAENQKRGDLFDQRHGTVNGRKMIFDHLKHKNVVGSLRNPLDWYPSRLGYAKFRGNNLKFQNFDISTMSVDEFIQNLSAGMFANRKDPVIWKRLRFELDFFEIAKRCEIGLMSFEFILQYSQDPLQVFRKARIS